MHIQLPRSCSHAAFAFASLLTMSIVVAAQKADTDVPQDIHLNIAEKHITEAPFERSLQADLNAGEVRLRVGVSAAAQRVEITLRGVTGEAHFRASLEGIREQLARLNRTVQ